MQVNYTALLWIGVKRPTISRNTNEKKKNKCVGTLEHFVHYVISNECTIKRLRSQFPSMLQALNFGILLGNARGSRLDVQFNLC